MMQDSLLNYKAININENTSDILFDSNPLTTSYRIDPTKDIPELNRNNNTYKLSGLFKKIEPIQFKFFGEIESGNSTNIYFLPFVGWNNYDKWSPGISLYNSLVFRKRFEYRISPMYSFDKNRVVGFANLNYLMAPNINNAKNNIKLNLKFSRFSLTNLPYSDHYYNRFEPSLNFEFINTVRKNYRNNVTIGSVYLNIVDTYSKEFSLKSTSTSTMVYAKYDYKNINKLFPQKGTAMVEVYNDFSALSTDYTFAYAYNKKKKRVEARIFAGTILSGDGSGYWRLSGQNGNTDPRYESLYLGRLETEGLIGNQFINNHGGFKTPSKVSSGKWMVGTNFKIETPLFIGLFSDVAIVPVKKVSQNEVKNTAAIFIDAGFYLPIIRNEFEIYFPVAYNQKSTGRVGLTGTTFKQNIRFVLNLDFFNPAKATEKF